jgi:cysteine desulfurase
MPTIPGVSVYLDHAASTPLRAEVLAAMLPILQGDGGNPSSPHEPGRRARRTLDEAHERMAAAIGAEARAVVFTGGGTEAINLAIKGAAWAGKAAGHRILTTAVEHKAVLESCLLLEKYGFEVQRLPVDRYGQVDPDEVTTALTDRTILVSLQLANNEVGTIQPLAELIARVRAASPALVHVDAVQAAAHLPIDVGALGADLVSFAAHKVEGPKGVGALWIRRSVAILPQLHGGSQERYRRAGTENVAGVLGMAVAFELAAAERPVTVAAVRERRDRLRAGVLALEGIELTGHAIDRLANSLSLIVRGIPGDDLVMALDLAGLACATGSACTTGSNEPSHVLAAMGYPAAEARCALRLSLGRTTTDADIATAGGLLAATIERLRAGGARLAGDGWADDAAAGASRRAPT